MTESAVQESVAPALVKTTKKKVTTPKTKSVSKKTPATHPPTAQMVNNAIKSLKERGGSSLQAIKKYIAGTYKVDAEKLSPFIKKYLKSAVDNGKLIRTKGKGASGSFKLASSDTKSEKKPKKPKSTVKKPKTTKVKKPKTEKSAATPKKPKATKPKSEKPKTAPKKKSPSKAKKTTKALAAKKPKSPKPKKAASKKTAKKPAKK